MAAEEVRANLYDFPLLTKKKWSSEEKRFGDLKRGGEVVRAGHLSLFLGSEWEYAELEFNVGSYFFLGYDYHYEGLAGVCVRQSLEIVRGR